VRIQVRRRRCHLRSLRTDAVLARDADYQRVDLELGGALSRHELNVRLEGDGATAAGQRRAAGRRPPPCRYAPGHRTHRPRYRLRRWCGAGLPGRRTAVFHGGIVIREGADGTDAALSNKNLLLSANAEIDTQPVLEIHADEVKAAHGATVGQLDPTRCSTCARAALPEAEARALLTGRVLPRTAAGIEDATACANLLLGRAGRARARSAAHERSEQAHPLRPSPARSGGSKSHRLGARARRLPAADAQVHGKPLVYLDNANTAQKPLGDRGDR
jgi:Fe-S cluster assembly protein SufD